MGPRGAAPGLDLAGLGAVLLPLSLIVTDLVRLRATTQSILYSVIPHAVAWALCALLLVQRRLGDLPRPLRIGGACLLVMCLSGTAVAFHEGYGARAIAAGWLRYAGAFPPLVAGFAIARDPAAWARLARWLPWMMAGCIAFAVLQQAGIAPRGGGLEGYVIERGTFTYTTGPFRTANVFSSFLACMSLPLLQWYAEGAAHRRKLATGAGLAFSLAVLGAGVLSARRTGLTLILAVLLPYTIVASRRLGALRRVLLGAVALVMVLALPYLRPDGRGQLEDKLEHSFINIDLERLLNPFKVTEQDMELISLTGEGLRGADASAATVQASETVMRRFTLLHFGWYSTLATFGPLGLLLELCWWAMLVSATAAAWRAAGTRHRLATALSGVALVLLSALNYYLVSTIWIHGVSGGLLFGYGLGLQLGRVVPRPPPLSPSAAAAPPPPSARPRPPAPR